MNVNRLRDAARISLAGAGALWVVACGGRSLSGRALDGGGGGPADAGLGADQDAAVEVDVAVDGGADQDAAPTLFGQISFWSSPDLMDGFWMYAGFSPWSASGQDAACRGTLVGACCFRVATGPGLIVGPFPTAGTLTITDGAKTLARLEEESSGSYAGNETVTPSLTWAMGDTLEVAASGGEVAAFHAAVVVPADLSGLVPAFAGPLDLSVTSDQIISWNAGPDPGARILLTLADGIEAYITCTADDATGTLTVPSSLLARFVTTEGRVVLWRTNKKVVPTSNAVVELSATVERLTTAIYRR